MTPLGKNTGVNFSFTVTFQDPCAVATLTINPSTLTANPYTYVIDATKNVQTFLDSSVTSTATASCPTDFVFTVTNRDSTAFDTSLFTWDSSAQTFSTYTNDFSYYTNSPYLLTVYVAYAGGYSNAGSLDFKVIVDISCTSAVFDSFTVSDMTYSVFGTSAT